MPCSRLIHFVHLTRFHKPEGTVLLLWPALWALWLAAEGLPDLHILGIFIVGTFVMRAAGCAINDFADRKVDGLVERTRYRPVACGHIKPWEAVAVFVLLSLLGLALVVQLNSLTLKLALGAALIIACYPFMKRYTHLPQLVLGLAWAWSIPMAFAAQTHAVPPQIWLLMAGVVCWTIAFDTFYALVDRDDDLKVGIKSTAILFGAYDLPLIGLFQALTLIAFVGTGWLFDRGGFYFAGIALIALLFGYQLWLCRHRHKEAFFQAFLHNRWVGLTLFVAIVLDYALTN